MESKAYLPIGSIVYLKNGYKKIMIIGRGMVVRNQDSEVFFDYGAVQYPEGLLGDEIAYFQHEAIDKIVFNGYTDDDDEMTVKKINNYIKNHDGLIRG